MSKPKTFTRSLRKFVNGVRVSPLTLWNIVSDLECERGHVTLVFKVLVAKPVL